MKVYPFKFRFMFKFKEKKRLLFCEYMCSCICKKNHRLALSPAVKNPSMFTKQVCCVIAKTGEMLLLLLTLFPEEHHSPSLMKV